MHHKKSKQDKNKELTIFFGQGPQVLAPLHEGTPINIILIKSKDRRTNLAERIGGRTRNAEKEQKETIP